ncbi:MAG TPA: uroporphyrinogen-III synthase [Casimicrobiaceae bacterium]|jgi:uroporphyrinogen-III synthase
MSGPLSGIAVVVTRPARQAAPFAQQLAALGATPIVWPAIIILPPSDPDALARTHASLDRYDIAFFVSANAAEYGAPPVGRWPRRLKAYAPGPGTAAALAAVGVPYPRIPDTSQDSEGLLALPELAEMKGKRAIIFRGHSGRELLAETLRARGAVVDTVSCYRRAAPAGDARGLLDALRSHRATALTLTSTEGVDNLVGAAGVGGRAQLAQVPTFAPHARIVEHARALGLDARLTPGGDAGLIAGLLEWASHRTKSPD